MNNGDIFFIMNGTSKLGKIIAWFMKSNWSHAGLIYDVSGKEIYTIETTDLQVTPQFLNDYTNNDKIKLEVWSPINFTNEEREEVCERAKLLNEEVYGFFQLLSLGIRRLFMRVGIKIKNFIHSGLVCCHVVTYGYKGSKIKELDLEDPESIDTQELYELVINSQKFKKVFEK